MNKNAHKRNPNKEEKVFWNIVNGNYSDARKQIKSLNKLELFYLTLRLKEQDLNGLRWLETELTYIYEPNTTFVR